MRRRVVALVGALVVLGLLIWGGVAAVQGITATAKRAIAQNEAEATASATPAATEAPEETQEPSPSAVVADGPCDGDDVQVAAATDKQDYPEGEKPKLALQVTNGSSAACSIDVGTSQQEFIVLEGGDQIWSSADCQDVNADQERAREEVAFAPEETKESVLEWGVLRSTQGCTAVEQPVEPGDYELQVYLGEKKSKVAKFTIEKP